MLSITSGPVLFIQVSVILMFWLKTYKEKRSQKSILPVCMYQQIAMNNYILTVGTSSTHRCDRAIPDRTILIKLTFMCTPLKLDICQSCL